MRILVCTQPDERGGRRPRETLVVVGEREWVRGAEECAFCPVCREEQSYLEGGETASLYALPRGEGFKKTLRPACTTGCAWARYFAWRVAAFAERCRPACGRSSTSAKAA